MYCTWRSWWGKFVTYSMGCFAYYRCCRWTGFDTSTFFFCFVAVLWSNLLNCVLLRCFMYESGSVSWRLEFWKVLLRLNSRVRIYWGWVFSFACSLKSVRSAVCIVFFGTCMLIVSVSSCCLWQYLRCFHLWSFPCLILPEGLVVDWFLRLFLLG